jgi:hypothetical protein
MNRALRLLVAATCIGSTTACASFSTEGAVSLWSYEKTTDIEVSVPTGGHSFNWHGGGWYKASDTYKLTVPRGVSKASGSQIELKHKPSALPLPIALESTVEISRCTVTLNMLDERGKPYAFNGVYEINPGACRK